jgi:hypothetical protein
VPLGQLSRNPTHVLLSTSPSLQTYNLSILADLGKRKVVSERALFDTLLVANTPIRQPMCQKVQNWFHNHRALFRQCVWVLRPSRRWWQSCPDGHVVEAIFPAAAHARHDPAILPSEHWCKWTIYSGVRLAVELEVDPGRGSRYAKDNRGFSWRTLRAYPITPAARKVIQAQAKCNMPR